MHFSLHQHVAREHFSRVGQKLGIRCQRTEIGQRAAHVPRNHVEENPGRGREEADFEVRVEKNGRDVGAKKYVLQIVGGRALPIQRFLQLAVECIEFLVEGLQLLLGSQQLLVCGLIFLVDRQRLLIDRHLLLARRFEVVDRAL